MVRFARNPENAGASVAASLRGRERTLATTGSHASIEAARAVAHAAALGWWHAAGEAQGTGHHPVPTLPSDLAVAAVSTLVAADARAFGRDLASLPVAEANAVLGRLYTQALPPAHRTAHGIFYTPPALVRRLLDKAERAGHAWRTGRAIDPSCGGGAFLVEAASRMVAALADADPAIILAALASRLRGWDLDPFRMVGKPVGRGGRTAPCCGQRSAPRRGDGGTRRLHGIRGRSRAI
ncbi:hypothetical protein [Siccirubricoccus sp. G192]|uniref:hypothetical protein n=1 Tax=Siccirubricoccus sp. G192 TaxID=2849651 RepID=UPI001C2C425B|nr:hypothetical protein [Siccirubricoccus sp. G192]MBV1800175.1 hypothetical protein [Siccirubricoccus sp. G192]